MDRLEQQLRSVLSDERLDVHVSPGAVQAVHDGVRRRRRRNAMLSAAASFALVAGGIVAAVGTTQGGHDVVEPGQHNPTPTTTPSKLQKPPAPGLRQGVVIQWTPTAYDPTKPFALAGTTPDSDVPWCAASQLSLAASEFQGATGSAAGGLTLTNNGNVCAVQGSPVLTGYDDKDKVVATSAPDDAFLVHPWVALQHGEQARTFVQVSGDGSKCLSPVKRLDVDLGHGITSLSVDLPGDGASPRCGTVAKPRQLDHYVVGTADWTRPDGSPRLPMGDFSATVSGQPTTVMQGATIRYRVLLSTQGASIDPCLPYREQLVSLDGSQSAVGTSYFLLDCAAIREESDAQSYLLDMQLAVPMDTPPGDYTLQWQTPIRGLGADEGQTIRITAAPPKCTIDQLTLTAGGSGAATTHYAQTLVLTNSSSNPCSLRGYPGVQFFDGNGHPMRTRANWTTSAFMWQLTGYETVRLPPGARASFNLGGIDYDVVHNQPCPTAHTVKIIPPGLADQLSAVVDWPACLRGKVDVSPVGAGSHGPR